jgi:hypothetical protein
MDLEAWRHGGVVLIVTGRGIRVGDGRRHALPSPTRIRTKTKLHGRGRGASKALGAAGGGSTFSSLPPEKRNPMRQLFPKTQNQYSYVA